MNLEFKRVRGFLFLHFVATNRSVSPFWKYLTAIELPDSLTHKIDLFKSSERVVNYVTGAFKMPSCLAVYYGQNIVPLNKRKRTDKDQHYDL